jgi:hypothetical protein
MQRHLPERYKAYGANPTKYYEDFIHDLVTEAAPYLEQVRNRHSTTSEEGLTDLLIARLGALYLVVSEANDNGHVDICLILPFTPRRWKGEAKILRSPSWYGQGLTKLAAKYNSGREDHAFMVGYCKEPDMYILADQYRADIEGTKCANFEKWVASPASLRSTRSVFLGRHAASGAALTVAHVWINMHYETDEELAARGGGRGPSTRSVGGKKQKKAAAQPRKPPRSRS